MPSNQQMSLIRQGCSKIPVTMEGSREGSRAADEKDLDPRVRRTRKMLQDALASLLKKKDFDKISIGDIAEESTLNRATFYDHYPDKFSLLECLVGSQFQELIAQRNICFNGCAGALRSIATGVCCYLAETMKPGGWWQAGGGPWRYDPSYLNSDE